MSQDIEETKKYDVLADELFVYCRQAIDTINYRVLKINPALGIIHAAKINRNMKFEISITPVSDQESNLYIKAYSINGFGGRVGLQHPRKCRKHLDNFLQLLDAIVRRAKIQYR